ncbi:hypothetical protein SOVF_113110 [Spinacia oleracea]|uniref:SHSP domain-containing protein n=1 Tax=Spinacia oleracea TaxID=3562 RepID=A0A9R0JSG4_SPIOL|nr:uncharacterized protein LOC110785313 [Spinacia oleracea]KNA13762.1 hypothetical protein SOVF_113110 [Spinacia oleracea]
MAIKTKSSTPGSPSYVDFHPACDFLKAEGIETLIIHLPDFKKEQLRVQVNKEGVVIVSGERATNEDGSKRSRFVKETKIPEGCDINDIRAKFINGRLNVTMPKKILITPPPPPPPPPPQLIQEQPPSSSSPPPPPPKPEAVTDQKPKPEAASVSDDQTPKGSTIIGGTETSCSYHGQPKSINRMFELGSVIQSRLQGRKNVALGFGIAVVTMVAIGAFVASKLGSDTTSSPSLYIEDSGLM